MLLDILAGRRTEEMEEMRKKNPFAFSGISDQLAQVSAQIYPSRQRENSPQESELRPVTVFYFLRVPEGKDADLHHFGQVFDGYRCRIASITGGYPFYVLEVHFVYLDPQFTARLVDSLHEIGVEIERSTLTRTKE